MDCLRAVDTEIFHFGVAYCFKSPVVRVSVLVRADIIIKHIAAIALPYFLEQVRSGISDSVMTAVLLRIVSGESCQPVFSGGDPVIHKFSCGNNGGARLGLGGESEAHGFPVLRQQGIDVKIYRIYAVILRDHIISWDIFFSAVERDIVFSAVEIKENFASFAVFQVFQPL